MTKRVQSTSLLKPISELVVILTIILTLNGVVNEVSLPVQPEKVVVEPTIIDVEYQPFEINTYDDMIEYWCMAYEVDSNLAIAISRLETGHYTSEVFTECNNFGGMVGSNGFMKFRNSMEGCEAFVKMLKYGYIEQGLDTVEEIGHKYCPINEVEWITVVSELIKERN